MAYTPPADYVDVAERIREFRDKHPDGSLQQVEWHVETIGDRSFVCYTAAAYRNPSDERPGIGTAWEPFPGPTQFTRDSELMNAETSAWGRAIIAALAGDAKRVASANEVANRQGPPAGDAGVRAVENAFGVTAAQDTPRPARSGDTSDIVVKFGEFKDRTLGSLTPTELGKLLATSKNEWMRGKVSAELEGRGVTA